MVKRCLSGNALKLMACAFMLIDHVGAILLPELLLLRYVGRLAFPIFAFLISEGARHTRHRRAYLLRLLALGIGCQAVVLFFVGDGVQMNIFLTFSLSIALIYLLRWCAHLAREAVYPPVLRYGGAVLLLAAVFFAVFFLTCLVTFDYGFFGVLAPVLAALPDVLVPGDGHRGMRPMRLSCFALGLALLSVAIGMYEYLCLLALPLLALYSGERGRHRLKYFFYAFYPLHLAVLYGIRMLLL